jgi:hypothetical protein
VNASSTATGATNTAALYRDALAAVREALDIPHAATVGWEERRQQILDRRLSHAVVMLDGVLEANPAETPGGRSLIAHRTAYLRERLAEHPAVGYVTQAEAHEALEHGAAWSEAVAEPRESAICGPG